MQRMSRLFSYLLNSKMMHVKFNAVLQVYSHKAYLAEKDARSRSGRNHFLNNFVSNLEKGVPKLNSLMRTLQKVLKNSALSVAKSKLISAFKNS